MMIKISDDHHHHNHPFPIAIGTLVLYLPQAKEAFLEAGIGALDIDYVGYLVLIELVEQGIEALFQFVVHLFLVQRVEAIKLDRFLVADFELKEGVA